MKYLKICLYKIGSIMINLMKDSWLSVLFPFEWNIPSDVGLEIYSQAVCARSIVALPKLIKSPPVSSGTISKSSTERLSNIHGMNGDRTGRASA